MSALHPNTCESLLRAAMAAHRCREAAKSADPVTRQSLIRAADRYSGRVAELAAELAAATWQ
jgi:hypothetical protein